FCVENAIFFQEYQCLYEHSLVFVFPSKPSKPHFKTLSRAFKSYTAKTIMDAIREGGGSRRPSIFSKSFGRGSKSNKSDKSNIHKMSGAASIDRVSNSQLDLSLGASRVPDRLLPEYLEFYELFLRPNAPLQVDISPEVLKPIREAMERLKAFMKSDKTPGGSNQKSPDPAPPSTTNVASTNKLDGLVDLTSAANVDAPTNLAPPTNPPSTNNLEPPTNISSTADLPLSTLAPPPRISISQPSSTNPKDLITLNVFDHAKNEIIRSLFYNTFPRFLRTPENRSLRHTVSAAAAAATSTVVAAAAGVAAIGKFTIAVSAPFDDLEEGGKKVDDNRNEAVLRSTDTISAVGHRSGIDLGGADPVGMDDSAFHCDEADEGSAGEHQGGEDVDRPQECGEKRPVLTRSGPVLTGSGDVNSRFRSCSQVNGGVGTLDAIHEFALTIEEGSTWS
ncbi:hypothetical protein HK102_002538, partial [Quaeritorhiza haematococci]